MAEKVTVKGGGQIDGAHFDNAASEVTLERVADAIEKLEKKLGGKGGGKAEVNGMFNQALAGNAKQLDTATDRSAVFSGMLKETSKETKNFASSLASAAGSIISSGLGMAFGLVAAGTTKLFEAFTGSLDSFREVSAVGASFNNDLVLLRKTAAEAAMPLGMFTESIKKNSQLFSQLGGTVTGGAQAFAKMSGQLRTGEFGTQMMGMGMTMGDLNDYMTDYLDIQMRMGRIQGKTEKELLAGTQDYILEMDKLSKATGLSRKQVEEGLKKAMADGRIQFMASKLTGQALTNFQSGVSLINNKFPEFADTLTDSMSGIVKPGDQFGALMASTVPGFMEFNRAMGEGKLSQEDIVAGYKKQQASLSQTLGRFSKEQIAAIPHLQKASQYLGKLNEVIGSNTPAALAQQKIQNQITTAMGSFGQKIEEVKSKIILSLINSGVFDKVQVGLTKLAEWFNDNVNEIAPFFDKLIKGIDDNLMAGDLSGAIGSAFDTLFSALKPIAIGAIRALFENPEKKKERKELEAKRADLTKRTNTEIPDMADISALAKVNEDIAKLDKDPFADISKSITSAIPGFDSILKIVQKVEWAFDNLGTVIGVGSAVIVGLTVLGSKIGGAGSGLGGAISGLSKGIGDLIANIASGLGTAIGKLLEGLATGIAAFASLKVLGGAAILGASITLIGAGIAGASWILGKALPTLAEGLASFGNINGDNLISVGKGVAALGAGLAVFGAGGALGAVGNVIGNLVDGFGRLFGGKSQVDKLKEFADLGPGLSLTGTGMTKFNEGLKSLSEVNSEMLAKLAPALDSISKPLIILGGTSILALMGGNSLSNLATSLKAFEEIDPSKIANVGPALEGLHKALSLFTGGNEGLFSSIGTALGSLVKGDNGIGKLAESFKAFNVVDGANLNNVATGMTSLKTSIGDDLAKQADGVKTFADSIKSLATNIQNLQTSLEKLNKTPGGPQAATAAAGAVSQGGNDGSVTTNASAEKLEKLNTLVTELVSVAKETRDFNKDQVDAIKDRGSAMGRK